MAQLAILGHKTRGKEVIELLEMLGGKNKQEVGAIRKTCVYFIDEGIINFLKISQVIPEQFIIYTLEEFLEKFPYKVEDKVVYKYDKKTYFIRKMFWENGKILYELSDEIYLEECSAPYTLIFDVDVTKLQPYKEETMADKIESLEVLESHCANEVKIEFDPSKYEMVKRDNGYYVVKKQPKYPKTFIEVLSFWHPDRQIGDDYQRCYKKDLIEKFQDLLYARDAYWKIAGEQMGLGKSWEPDFGNENEYKYGLFRLRNIIYKDATCINPTLLIFPTAEMRDAFYENFKELIETCKELL